jgi:hypothetical protein
MLGGGLLGSCMHLGGTGSGLLLLLLLLLLLG